MPLEENSSRFVGHKIFVQPYYGYGWSKEGTNHSPDDTDISRGPKSFHVLVGDLLKHDNRIIGICGKIIEAGHLYDGYRCLACVRHSEEYNFQEKPGHYMIWIARNEPDFLPSAEKALYQYVTLDKSAPCLCGYGILADSPSRVQRYVELAETRIDLT